jgi:hypothetical protein
MKNYLMTPLVNLVSEFGLNLTLATRYTRRYGG